MNLLQAKQKLKELAGGKHHTVSYTIKEYSSGSIVQECSVYMADKGFHTAETFELALDSLRQTIKASAAPPHSSIASQISDGITTVEQYIRIKGAI